jgi:DNA-binding response OmpR family regulator
MLRIVVLLRRTYKFNARSSQQRVLQLGGLSLDKSHQGIVYHE